MALKKTAFALAIAAVSAIGHTAELGRLTIYSRLGQPLNAEAEIVDLKAGEERTLVGRLASRAAYRKSGIAYNPALASVRAAVAEREGKPVLRLRSSRTLDEPFLELLVEIESNAGRQLRTYTVLLDPAGYQAPSVEPRGESEEPANEKTVEAAVEDKSSDEAALPLSRESLFGDLPGVDTPAKSEGSGISWRGFIKNTLAYDYQEPGHWSRGVIRTQVGAQGGSGNLKWKATARLDLDPVYAANDFYLPEVRRDQRRDLFLRETYIDTSLGGFDLRLGKQNIVWGEMVGLFFADVVSARDQRDFILPEFEIIRIPQWAIRAERFGEDTHAEIVWLPAPEVDIIGKPGAEFYPFQAEPPAGFDQRFNNVERPTRNLSNSNLGLRASMLKAGWDLSAFYYRSTDVNPTFYREVVLGPTPTVVFTPRHDRIWQVGGTLGKDLGPTVLKAEVIYTEGRKFNVTRITEPDGVVPQDTLDYVIGLDFTFSGDTRLNLQYFDRIFSGHDPDLIFERREDGVSLLLSSKFGPALEPELLVIRSLRHEDYLVRAKLGWIPAQNWRFTFGVDVFEGPLTGLFGRFRNNDRVYLETRYDF